MARLPRRSWLVLGASWVLAAVPSVERPAQARPAQARPAQRPATVSKGLDYGAAQQFVLSLVNRDRAKAGLSPVSLDEAASKAGLRHARDMASNGFTGHIGSDGSPPEQRYTQSGGVHFVQENAACLFDGKPRKLEASPRFDPTKLAELHEMFMNEVPPNDGHRRNILKPLHNRVGIGLAQPAGVNQPCLAQEFVDQYGDYTALPQQAKPNAALRIAGSVSEPLTFGGVGVGRTDLPRPKRIEELGGARGYLIPAPDTLYYPPGFKSPKPVQLSGKNFSIDLGLGGQPGQYAISIWAKTKGSNKLFMISLRTITVQY